MSSSNSVQNNHNIQGQLNANLYSPNDHVARSGNSDGRSSQNPHFSSRQQDLVPHGRQGARESREQEQLQPRNQQAQIPQAASRNNNAAEIEPNINQMQGAQNIQHQMPYGHAAPRGREEASGAAHANMDIQPQNIINNQSLPRNLGGNPEGNQQNRGSAPSRQAQQNAPQNQRDQGPPPQQDIFQAPSQQRQFVLDDFQHREDGDMQPGIPGNNNVPYNPEADPQSYRILHQDNFRATKVLTQSSQASIFIGNLRNYDNIIQNDRQYVVGKKVVLKQFQLKKERTGFKKELKILKKIKSLDLKDNGGFPVIISAKLSNSLGEILMSYAGRDIFEVFDIQESLEDSRKHRCFNLKKISVMGMQIVSQIEILHKLGYTHGDLKFQNICYNEETHRYSIIDFALVTKIFHKNGQHKEQEKVKSFYGNSLFASDSMVNLLTTSRKDDLESLVYILCYLYTGILPIIEFINQNIDNFNMSQFLSEVLKYRVEHTEKCHARVKELLPENLIPAFQYIVQLGHATKPDYNLIKLWLACSEEEEQQVFTSKLVIKNERMAKDILYDHSIKDVRMRPGQQQEGQGQGQAKGKNSKKQLEPNPGNANPQQNQDGDQEEEVKIQIQDMNKSYEFDADCDELSSIDNPIDIIYRKVDGEKVRKQMVRKLIFDRREKRERSFAAGGSQSSNSQINDGFMQEVQSQSIMGQFCAGSVNGSNSDGMSDNKSLKRDDLSENGAKQAQGGHGFPQQFSNIFNQIIYRKEKGGLAKKADELKQRKANQAADGQPLPGEEEKVGEFAADQQQDVGPLIQGGSGNINFQNQQQQFFMQNMPQFDQNQQQLAMGQFLNLQNQQFGQLQIDANQLQQLQQAAFINHQMFVPNPAALQQMQLEQMAAASRGNSNFIMQQQPQQQQQQSQPVAPQKKNNFNAYNPRLNMND